ncbi:Uncharacterised protein [uncultured archaeon]|nr:Uncharacterised protein [uncultured archaeon]
MENTVNIILLACSVISGFIGYIFVMKIFFVWNRVDLNLLKARVFLDPKFLVRNWAFIFTTGAFIVMRRLLELFDVLKILVLKDISVIFDLMGLAVVVSLVIMAYFWYKIINSSLEHNPEKDAPKK